MKNWRNKIAIFLFLFLLILLPYFFRNSILRAVYGGLIDIDYSEDSFRYGIILSGNANDRASFAADLFHKNKIDTLICLGENIPHNLKALDMPISEAEITKHILLKNHVPTENIYCIERGHSTYDEFAFIQSFLQTKNANALLISSDIHSARMSWLRKHFELPEDKVHIKGVPSEKFNRENWWQSEEGLIAVSNEWEKRIYYLLKY